MTTASICEIMKKMKQTLSYKKLARPTALKGLQAEEKQDPFKILIGTILSARTRDEITTRVVNDLFRKFKNPEELAKADIEEVRAIIHSIGFYNVKAKRIKEVSQLIVERFNGEVPSDIRKLLEIPGDIHVHRISNRLGLVNTKSPEKTEIELSRILDKKYWLKVNDTFVMYGQNICLPIKPNCNLCKLKEVCKFYHTTVLPIWKNSSLKTTP